MAALTLREVALDDVKRLLPRGDDRLRRVMRRLTDEDRTASATALLDVLRGIRPARAGVAAAGLAGRLEPLSDSGPWFTEVAASELVPVVRWVARPTWEGNRASAARSLTRCADLRLVNPLLDRLRGGPTDAAEYIMEEALPRYGPALLPDLRRGLAWDDHRAQARVLFAVRHIDRKLAAELCVPRLEDPDFNVRQDALLCLAKAAPDEARRVAFAWLETATSRKVRSAAWQCLHRAMPHEARHLPALLRAVVNGYEYGAAATVASVGKPAVRPLIDLLGSPDPQTRERAVDVLGALGATAAPAVPRLIELTCDPDERVLRNAVWALKQIGPAAGVAVPRLIEMMSERYCCMAAEALVVVGRDDPAAAAAIVAHLETADRDLREHVVNRVIALGPAAKAAVPRLVALLFQKPKDWHFRQRVAAALAAVGPPGRKAVPALEEALTDSDEGVRYPVAVALGLAGPSGKAALPVLIEAICEEDKAWWWAQYRKRGLEALASLGRAAVPALTKVAQSHSYEQARRDAAEALARIAGAR
ncbi:MAG TPA: HEAT repeat domain-containing protein [Gemmataceae bacterium]|nr:HEAT repeat domain-containing protein [Gemmataceae bacterium]